MSIEIEKKYRLTAQQKTLVTTLLSELEAEFVGREFEENTVYSSRALRSSSAILRIRKIGERTLLTYKRRIENDVDVKRQIEHETEIADAKAIESIIGELGMSPTLLYEKYRDTWKFRSVELVIDELPFGLFMEIEGSIMAIKEAEILLGIDDFETEPETYPRLTARHGEEKGDLVEARFKEDDKR